MRLLSTSLLLLLNFSPVVSDTGKTEPPKFDRHPDEKPPKFDRDGTDAPVPLPTPRPTDAPVWPPTPAPVRPPPPTRPPTPSPTPPPTRPPTPRPNPAPVPAPVVAPVPGPRDDEPGDSIIGIPPTPQPTPNPTPQPTPNPTPQPTPNPTPRPTPNPTPQPTPLPTTALPTTTQNIFELAEETGKFDILLSHVGNTPGLLTSVVSNMPVTIFGPTDIAFGDGSADGLDPAALGAVIGGHVVPGVLTTEDIIAAGCLELMTLSNVPLRIRYANGMITINDAQVTCADVTGPGGNILGVGSVILPGSFRPCRNGYVEQAFENGLPDPQFVEAGSMYDRANADGDYGILLAAITRSTGVQASIASHGEVTIFGPNDKAYNEMYEMLATTDIPDVGRMFSGHVVKGVITLREMVEKGCMELTSMSGTSIRVMVKNQMVHVNDALLVGPDMAGEDGIIQGIDKLLMPDSFEPCPGQTSGVASTEIRFGSPVEDEPEPSPSSPQEEEDNEEEDEDEEDDDKDKKDKKDKKDSKSKKDDDRMLRRLRGPSTTN